MKYLLGLALVLLSASSLAKAIALSQVLCHAISHAPQFERVRTDLTKGEVISLRAQVPLGSKLEVSGNYQQQNFRLDRVTTDVPILGNGSLLLPQLRSWETREAGVFWSKGLISGTNIRAGASYQNQILNFGGSPNADIHIGSLALELSQDLWRNFFGKSTRSSLQAARAQKRATEMQVDLETQSLLKDLQVQYATVWREWSNWQLAQENEQANKDYYDIVKAMSDQGLADGPALMQSESSWITSRQATLESLTRFKNEMVKLEQLSGLEISHQALNESVFSLPEVNDRQEFCDKGKDFEQALSVQTLKRRIDAARITKKVAQDMRSPQLSLGLSVSNNSYRENRPGAINDLFARTYGMHYGVGLNLEIPLDDFERQGSELEAAADTRRLEASLRESLRETRATRDQLCTELEQNEENKRLLQAKKSNNREIAQTLLARWRVGRVPFNEVLRAQSDYYQSSRELTALQWAQRFRSWNLYLLWGRVWKIEDQCPSHDIGSGH